MLRTLLLFLLLSYVSNAKYIAKCSNSTEDSFIFEPADDEVEGRYKVEWCTQADRNVSWWELSLRYNDHRSPERCQHYKHNEHTWPIHSRQIEPVMLDLNCTNVCFTTYMDLIFNNTCYHIKTFLKRGRKSSSPYDSLHYVTNNYAKDHFTNSESRVSAEDYEDTIIIRWFLGFVPATNTEMELCLKNSSVNYCSNIGANCSLGAGNEVVCELRRAPLRPGCYAVWLKHRAAWVAGESLFRGIKDGSYEFCNEPGLMNAGSAGGVWAGAAPALRWAGGAAGLAAVALLVTLLARSRRGAAMRRRVLGDWRSRPGAGAGAEAEAGAAARGRVLLLYARDCDLFVRVVQQLKLMLQKDGFQVVDVYGCDTLADSASAAGDWIRQLVARPDTRLLLLQSPAAAALYTATLPDGPRPRLERPLLWARGVPRRPRGGDALLLRALRLLAEAAPAPDCYRKCYLAELAGLEADMFPHVTPLRRYVLPAAAPLLLRDLAAGAPPPGAAGGPLGGERAAGGPGEEDAASLARAARRLLEYVRARPDYLSDELLLT